MTPAKRKRLVRYTMVGVLLLGGGIAARLFKGETIAMAIMGRKATMAAEGTPLFREKEGGGSLPSAPRKERPAPKNISFDVLTNWKYDEARPLIPSEVKAYDGVNVEITGFMMPISETQNITRFLLVNSLWGCCFGQAPAVNHTILVTMEPGKVVDFYGERVKVTGVLSIGETREEGILCSIFCMEASKVVAR